MQLRKLGWLATAFAATTALTVGGAASAPAAMLQPATAQQASRQAAPQSVLLISLDGFRADYLQRPGAVRLRALAAVGVHAERMVPAFPSKTFPNHYSIVTGLYTEHHGIVANSMRDTELGVFGIGDHPAVRDARWWDGEPIWVTAEKQHVRTAPFLWPGAEAPIGGIRPWFWMKFDNELSYAARVQKVLGFLTIPDTAPRFVTVYFPGTDDAGHDYGPDSPQVDSAIAHADSAVGAMVDGIAKAGLSGKVNIIVVADHGMAAVSTTRRIYLDDYISMDSVDVIDWTPVGAIAPKPGREKYVYDKLHDANPHLAVYRKGEVPARFHFNAHKHITPIVAIAEEGWTITTRVRAARVPVPKSANGGAHGYDNLLPSMGALFVASGPAFKSGLTVKPFQNVHVYSLIAQILGIKPAATDGSLDSVRVLLKPR